MYLINGPIWCQVTFFHFSLFDAWLNSMCGDLFPTWVNFLCTQTVLQLSLFDVCTNLMCCPIICMTDFDVWWSLCTWVFGAWPNVKCGSIWCVTECDACPNLMCGNHSTQTFFHLSLFDTWSNLMYGPIWCMVTLFVLPPIWCMAQCDTWSYLMRGPMWYMVLFNTWPNMIWDKLYAL